MTKNLVFPTLSPVLVDFLMLFKQDESLDEDGVGYWSTASDSGTKGLGSRMPTKSGSTLMLKC